VRVRIKSRGSQEGCVCDVSGACVTSDESVGVRKEGQMLMRAKGERCDWKNGKKGNK